MEQTVIISDILDPKDLKRATFSIDKVCTLFFYEDRVLRGIHTPYEEQVRDIIGGGLLEELIAQDIFVQTWISDVQIKGYNLVIEHENIPYWNYPYEWSFTMLHQAANTVLKCNEIAGKYGYEFFDVHAYNVVFQMNSPKYVDFGSIFKKDARNGKSWSGYVNFYNSFYIPLYLYNRGYSDLPNSIFLYNGLYNDKDLFFLRYPYARILGSGLSSLFYKATFNKRRLAVARYSRVIEKYGKHKHLEKLLRFKKMFQDRYTTKRAKRLLNSVKTSTFDSYWKNYHDDKNPEKDKRFLRIKSLIDSEMGDAVSAVELASNQGKFANYILHNTHLDTVISTDYDKNALDQNFQKHRKDSNYLTLVYDFVRPNLRSNTNEFHKRIGGDIVIALAVTHHLLLTQDVSLEHIFDTLEDLSNKYIIVEFMPLGLYFGDMNNIPPVPEYYTLSWFRKCFSERFDHLQDEEVAVNRHLFIGKLK